jgi:hypothetical protein
LRKKKKNITLEKGQISFLRVFRYLSEFFYYLVKKIFMFLQKDCVMDLRVRLCLSLFSFLLSYPAIAAEPKGPLFGEGSLQFGKKSLTVEIAETKPYSQVHNAILL